MYPRAWIAQDFAEPEWDGRGEEPEPWDGTGDMPPFEKARAHIDPAPDATEIVDASEWATVEEAIAWARARVEVVLVRVGYSDYYSAGNAHPDQFPRRWPPSEDAVRNETRRV